MESANSMPSTASTDSCHGGLLGLLKKSKNNPSSKSSGGNLISSKWESLGDIPKYSVGDINIQRRQRQADEMNSKNLRGWRVIDGEKVYTTIRKDGIVKAKGKNAFLLSRVDKRKNISYSTAKKGRVVSKRPRDDSESSNIESKHLREKVSEADPF